MLSSHSNSKFLCHKPTPKPSFQETGPGQPESRPFQFQAHSIAKPPAAKNTHMSHMLHMLHVRIKIKIFHMYPGQGCDKPHERRNRRCQARISISININHVPGKQKRSVALRFNNMKTDDHSVCILNQPVIHVELTTGLPSEWYSICSFLWNTPLLQCLFHDTL